jgi:hypothetical protein
MDVRLLQALSDVLGGDYASVTIAAGPSGSDVGSNVSQALYARGGQLTAGTGTPIPLLRGVAADRATRSALGGGPKSASAGGMAAGDKILSDSALKAQLAVYGVKAAFIVGAVAVRYAVLVRADRKAALGNPTDEGTEETS